MRQSLSLKWLEVFQLVSKLGSIQKVADESGLSISTVSNHLRKLEKALDVDLVDHNRRPMVLTPAGNVFARHVAEGLTSLRRGEAELRSGRWRHAAEMRLALVDDFDNEVAPDLFQILHSSLPRCSFRHFTRPSHEIIARLQAQKLDVGVATRPEGNVAGLVEYPLMRDPFIVVLPKTFSGEVGDLTKFSTSLPFLRYSREHTIGQLIETQLTRNKLNIPNKFELECNQAIMGMVAESSGWTITTAASYLRASDVFENTRVISLPGRMFVRTVSLFTSEVYPVATSRLIYSTLQNLIARHFITPMTLRFPWLTDEFRTL